MLEELIKKQLLAEASGVMKASRIKVDVSFRLVGEIHSEPNDQGGLDVSVSLRAESPSRPGPGD